MTEPLELNLHPVQFGQSREHPSQRAKIPEQVALRADEVYCEIWGEQPALISKERDYRGGFSVGEVVCLLYAHTFPKAEWRNRFKEAQAGMTLR